MVEKITKGIKISVKTKYTGEIEHRAISNYVFDYFITIENQSDEIVQLTDRHWVIFDSLNNTEIVDGEGVVGQTPILNPGDNYTYKSSCVLASTIGAMKGFFRMKNLASTKQFKVIIPTFQLTTLVLSN
jgi:ApaG protein